ncbi:MAG: DUF177 domain-containing protein [Mangrovibacterium sp.]
MAKLSAYNIAFKGLALGRHTYDYHVDKRFFDYFDGGLANDGEVDVKVKLEKESSLMILWFSVNGTVDVQCDRCLDRYMQTVKSENRVFVKFGEEKRQEEDDIIWLGATDSLLNVAKLIYDFIILSLPARQVHPDDAEGRSTCNPDMLRRLEALSVQERPGKHADKRWDKLKDILND